MGKVQIVEDAFGYMQNPITGDGESVKRFTFNNDNGVTIQVVTYGATVTSIRCPDKYGNIADIALGFDELEGSNHKFYIENSYLIVHNFFFCCILGYRSKPNPYFGASIGRVCNRVGNGQFDLNGQHFEVDKNFNGVHQLHGGTIGFDKFNWQAQQFETKVIMTHVNPAGFQGYPGIVMAQVTYELFPDGSFSGKYTATVSKSTPINLTNHSYFNLAGHVSTCTKIIFFFPFRVI